MVRADFGSGLIPPRAQTCCASPTRTPARLANSPGFKSFRCTRWRIKFSLERFSAPSHFNLRAQPLESSLGRVPQATDETCKQTSFNQIVLVVEVSLPRFRGHKNERECWQGECFMDNASKRAKHLRRCFIARIQSRSCSPFPNQGSFHRSCRCRSEFW